MDLREMPSDASARRHPWETSRLAFFAGVLEDHLPAGRCRALDVGAGDAFAARGLASISGGRLELTCVDTGYERVGLPEHPGIRFLTRVPDEVFDVLTLLDVLEHVEDDRAFLSELASRQLRHGGLALVSVPAWPMLYTSHDRALGHYRRYRPRELRSVVESAGLECIEGGGLFHSLLVPRAASRALEILRRPEEDAPAEELVWKRGRALTALVSGVLSLDNRLSRVTARAGVALPGLSTWVLARRPERA